MKTTVLVASALATVLSMSVGGVASAADNEKCYGVAKAGQNGCASAAANHSCAGESTTDYNGQDWKLVPAGTCLKMGGKEQPFDGKGMISH